MPTLWGCPNGQEMGFYKIWGNYSCLDQELGGCEVAHSEISLLSEAHFVGVPGWILTAKFPGNRINVSLLDRRWAFTRFGEIILAWIRSWGAVKWPILKYHYFLRPTLWGCQPGS